MTFEQDFIIGDPLPYDDQTFATRQRFELERVSQQIPSVPRVPVRRARSDAWRIKRFLRTGRMPRASYLE